MTLIDFEHGTVDPTLADLPWNEARRAFERAYLQHHHAASNWNVYRMSQRIGAHHSTAWRALKRLGMPTDPHLNDKAMTEPERDRREAERDQQNRAAESAAGRAVYQASVAERAGVESTEQVVDIDDEDLPWAI
jgi:hypothetical protein